MMMMIVTTFGRRSSERKSRWKTIKENQRSLLSDRMAAHDVVFGVLRDERVVPVAGVVAVAVATVALVRVGRDGVETARIDDVAVVEVCGRLFALSSVPGLVFQGMAYAVEEEAAAAGVRVRVRVRVGEGRRVVFAVERTRGVLLALAGRHCRGSLSVWNLLRIREHPTVRVVTTWRRVRSHPN